MFTTEGSGKGISRDIYFKIKISRKIYLKYSQVNIPFPPPKNPMARFNSLSCILDCITCVESPIPALFNFYWEYDYIEMRLHRRNKILDGQ